MSILNDIERAVICGKQEYRTNSDFIDAIEAAVIKKLAEVSVEPAFYTAEVFCLPECATKMEWERVIDTTPYTNGDGIRDSQSLYPASAIAAARVQENERCAAWVDAEGEAVFGQDLDPYRLAKGIRALLGGPSHG